MSLIVQNKLHFPFIKSRQINRVINFVMLFLLLYSYTTFARGFTPKPIAYVAVSGQVTDGKNQPLAGISVNVKGLSSGTSTANDGRFTITVSNGNDTLVF